MTPKSAMILVFGLLPGMALACPGGEDMASMPFGVPIHQVKNRVTANGRTIGQIVLATVPRPGSSGNKALVYGSPEWSGSEEKGGVMVKVVQAPLGQEGESEDAITHRWLVRGKEVFAVPPNDIDPSLPKWDENQP